MCLINTYVQMAEVVYATFHPNNFSVTVLSSGCCVWLSAGFIFNWFKFKKKKKLKILKPKDKCRTVTIQSIVISAEFLAKHAFVTVT